MTRVVAIVQARMGSTRFPGKSLAQIAGRPMVAHVLERAGRIAGVDQVVLTTPKTSADRPLGELANRAGAKWWPDDHADLLACFQRCAAYHQAEVIIRITGDCPLLDPEGSAVVLAHFVHAHGSLDYVSNVGPETDGFDTEVMSSWALVTADREATTAYERHHVTPYIRTRQMQFRSATVTPKTVPGGAKWSVDDEEDLERIRAIYARMGASA